MNLIENHLEYLALSEASYALAHTGHCVLPDGFSDPTSIRLPKDGRPFLLHDDPLDIIGFTAERDGLLYVVIRGTQFTSGIEFAQEWCLDALCLPLHPLCGGNVHCGFNELANAIEIPAVVDVFIGHSLGAAVATCLWGRNCSGELVTFGCPRVGDSAFAKLLWKADVTRYVNNYDIVPSVPTDPPFQHGGNEITVHGPGSTFERKQAHALESYRAGMDALNPDWLEINAARKKEKA